MTHFEISFDKVVRFVIFRHAQYDRDDIKKFQIESLRIRAKFFYSIPFLDFCREFGPRCFGVKREAGQNPALSP